MHVSPPRRVGLTVAACASLIAAGVPAAAAEPVTFDGPTVAVGAGSAHSYVTADAEGHPTAIGLRLSADALDGLDPAMMQMFTLELPQDAPRTVFDHLTVDWNPQGHGPVFLKPHFDMHFYMTDEAAVGEITPMRIDYLPRASNVPPSQYMPSGYLPPVGPAVLNTVPDMGLHWTAAADAVDAPGYDFRHLIVAGSWDGEYTFLEPMMTREWMLSGQSVESAVAQPEMYTRSGYQPTTYSFHRDNDGNEYVVEFGGMTLRDAD